MPFLNHQEFETWLILFCSKSSFLTDYSIPLKTVSNRGFSVLKKRKKKFKDQMLTFELVRSLYGLWLRSSALSWKRPSKRENRCNNHKIAWNFVT